MKPAKQLTLLKESIDKWNQWRQDNPKRVVNFRYADLKGLDLSGANFDRIDLTEADLSGATLDDATFRRANLTEVNLSGASLVNSDLADADLREANLSNAVLRGTNLSGVRLYNTILNETLISAANTSRLTVWETATDTAEQSANYLIEGGQRVVFDNIELAEPIWRQLTDNAGQKFANGEIKPALIVGNFTDQQTDRTKSVAADLVERGYTPILAHIANNKSDLLRKLLGSFSSAAGLVVADFTGTKTLWNDLVAVMSGNDTPDITVQPIVSGNNNELDWDGLSDRYEWFLPIHRYETDVQLPVMEDESSEEMPEAATTGDNQEPEDLTTVDSEEVAEEIPEAATEEDDTIRSGQPEEVMLEVVAESEEVPEELLQKDADTPEEIEELLDPQDTEALAEEGQRQAAYSEDELADAVDEILPSSAQVEDGEMAAPADTDEPADDNNEVDQKSGEENDNDAGELQLDIDDSMFSATEISEELGPEVVEVATAAEQFDELSEDLEELIEQNTEEEQPENLAHLSDPGGEITPEPASGLAGSIAAETKASEAKIDMDPVDEPQGAGAEHTLEETPAEESMVEFPPPLEVKIVDDGNSRRAKYLAQKNRSRERWQQFFSWIIVLLPVLLIIAGIYYWRTGYVDVTVEIPDSAKAYVFIDNRPVPRSETTGGMDIYRIAGLWADAHTVRIVPTQVQDIRAREFVRLKSYSKTIDVQRDGDNIFRFVQFDTLYHVRKVAEGKFPNIDGSGNRLVYLRRSNNRLKDAPLSEVYIKTMQSGEEKRVRLRNAPRIDFEQPYFASGDGAILLNSPDVDYAYFVDAGRDSLRRVPLPPGYFNAIPRRDTTGFILQNKTFNAAGKPEKTFFPRVPVGNAVYVAGKEGVLLIEDEQDSPSRRALRFDCRLINLRTQDNKVLFKIRKGQAPYLSGSGDAKRIAISEYIGLNFEVSTTIKLWENDIFVDLVPPFKDGRREFADATGFHLTQANMDDSGRRIVYEYESNIYLLEFAKGVTAEDISQSSL